MVLTLIEVDVDPFEVLNMHLVLELCVKLEVTLKVYFKQMVTLAIMKVHSHRAKCDHGLTQHSKRTSCLFLFIN